MVYRMVKYFQSLVSVHITCFTRSNELVFHRTQKSRDRTGENQGSTYILIFRVQLERIFIKTKMSRIHQTLSFIASSYYASGCGRRIPSYRTLCQRSQALPLESHEKRELVAP